MLKKFLAFIATTLFAFISLSTHAQSGDLETLLQKLDSRGIYETAQIGTPQNLLITMDVSDQMSMLTKRHQLLHNSKNNLDAQSKGKLNEAEETALIEATKIEIDKVKASVFANKANGRIKVTNDYSNIPIVQVLITDVDALVELLNDPRVQSVSVVPVVSPAGSNNLQIIRQPTTASAGKVGANTRVVVLDDFLTNQNAPELQGKLVDAFEFNFYTSKPSPLCSTWGCGLKAHGQSIAAIVGLVAPEAKISFIRVIPSDLIAGLNWILANYQRAPAVTAVNMSFTLNPAGFVYTYEGGSYTSSCPQVNSAVSTLISTIISKGIIVVAASGNGGQINAISAPACMPGVISVGAVTDSNESNECIPAAFVPPDTPACFSNSSILLKVLAPGTGITDSTNPNGSSGTSQATPHVTGAVAVLRGTNAFPGESNDTTMSRLYSTGKIITDPRNSIPVPRLRLDAASGSLVPPVPTPLPPNCGKNPALCF